MGKGKGKVKKPKRMKSKTTHQTRNYKVTGWGSISSPIFSVNPSWKFHKTYCFQSSSSPQVIFMLYISPIMLQQTIFDTKQNSEYNHTISYHLRYLGHYLSIKFRISYHYHTMSEFCNWPSLFSKLYHDFHHQTQ